MAEATLNAIKSAQYQINGNVRLLCNITTPDGFIWDTDFVVDPEREPPIEPLGGLQGAVERWVAANPGEILPFDQESPPERNDPVCENPPPEPEPLPPTPPPVEETEVPDVPPPPDIITNPETGAEGVDPNVEPNA